MDTNETTAILEAALGWHRAGQGVAIATVVETWGSSPRPVGSRMAISDSNAFVGSVSGGCVENAIIRTAREVIASGAPRLLSFGIADADALAVGLPCGGTVSVFVERIDP